MVVKIALIVGLLYLLYPPVDTSNLPYPTTKEGMQEEIIRMEEFLINTEEEYLKKEALCKTLLRTRPFAQDTSDLLGEYTDLYIARRNAKCRIDNLRKLIGKYEEIDHLIAMRDITFSSV